MSSSIEKSSTDHCINEFDSQNYSLEQQQQIISTPISLANNNNIIQLNEEPKECIDNINNYNIIKNNNNTNDDDNNTNKYKNNTIKNSSDNSSANSNIIGDSNEEGDKNVYDQTTITSAPLAKNSTNYCNCSMLIAYGPEFICVLALILTTYATFQNVPPKVSKAPAPIPFFSKGSMIHDWPAGELKNVQNRVTLGDLTFVMFYAPWCAESQHARSPYEHVAKIFYREASFTAVNCWQPSGECRQHYTKVMSWPVLMAYLQNGIGVPYTGKWTNASLTKFIMSLLRPIQRITTTDELLKLLIKHDAVIALFLDLQQDKKIFSTFYQTAVKWIEKDPYQDVVFTIITGKSAVAFNVEEIPSIRMYLWNETLISQNDSFTPNDLSKYINDNIHQISLWVTPPGTKSKTLGTYFKNGPIFMLFTPRNLYMDSMGDAYRMIKQIGLEYFNCDNEEYLSKMANVYIAENRNVINEKYLNIKNNCETILRLNDMKSRDRESSTSSCSTTQGEHSISITYNNYSKFISSVEMKNKQQIDYDVCKITKKKSTDKYGLNETDEVVMHRNKWLQQHNIDLIPSNIRSFKSEIKISMLLSEYDNRSPENLLKLQQRKQCEFLWLSERIGGPLIYFENYQTENFSDISGLACKQNQTLSLLVIDSLVYNKFAEQLGIDILNYQNKTAAIIIDHENESTHILKNDISATNIKNFIFDFTQQKLSRYLKTSGDIELNIEPIADNLNKTVHLLEIDSKNFDIHVMNSAKTVIVLFYTAQCALCILMTQSLLIASRILMDFKHLEFVRIDSDKNDLSWQYTMDLLPTLLIFPMERKTESRKFPTTLKVNVTNVLGFILANINRSHRLHALILICKNSMNHKKITSFDDCLLVLRKEITDSIQISLRQWRTQIFQRNQILRRLQILQDMYLKLFKINSTSNYGIMITDNTQQKRCDFNNLIESVKNLIKLWTYSNTKLDGINQ